MEINHERKFLHFIQKSPIFLYVFLIIVSIVFPQTTQEEHWKELNAQAEELYEQEKYEEAIPIAQKALKLAEESFGPEHLNAITSLNLLAELYDYQGNKANAQPLFQRALEIGERVLGSEHPEVARSLYGFARLHTFWKKKYNEAEPLYLRSLEIFKKTLGPEHIEVARVLGNLASLYSRQGKYDKAEPLYLRSIEITEKNYGTEHFRVGIALYNLALLYSGQRKYDEAESLYYRSLIIFEKSLEPENPKVTMTLNSLVSVYRRQGKHDEIEKLYHQILVAREKTYGKEHPHVALLLDHQAKFYFNQEKYDKAEPLYHRSLSIQEKAYGKEHPKVAIPLDGLAQLYHRNGKVDEAIVFVQRALRIKEKAYGEENIKLSYSLVHLASLYERQGKFDDAEHLMQRDLLIREKTYGAVDWHVAEAIHGLARFYKDQGKYDKAESLLQRAHLIWEKVYGKDHPNVTNSLLGLGDIYLYQGKYDQAEPLFRRALQIMEKSRGPEYRGLATVLHFLAWLYNYQGKYDQAEPLFRRALQIDEKTYGAKHSRVVPSLYSLAQLFLNQRKYDEAEPLLQRAISIYEKAYGTEHPNVAIFLDSLGMMYISQAKYDKAEPLLQRALDIMNKNKQSDHPKAGDILTNFARLYYAQGQYNQAKTFFDLSLQNLVQQFEYHFTYMSEKERLLFLDKVSEVFPIYFSFCLTYKKQDPDLVGSMYNVLLWQKGFVVSSISSLRSQIAASGDPEALTLLEKLTAKKTQLANLLIAEAEDQAQWRTHIEQLEIETNELEKELARRSITFAEQKRLAQVTWRDVQKALKKKEAAVEFALFRYHDGKRWTDKTYYAALILTPKSKTAPFFVVMGEEKKLEGTPLEEYRKLVEAQIKPREEEKGTAYSAFWKPMEAALAKSKQIYLSPDGVFNLISWGALPTEDDRLLMEKYDLRTVSSTKDILRNKPSHETSSAVLIGNPKFNLEEEQQRTVARSFQSTDQLKLMLAATERGRRSLDQRGTSLPPLPSTKEELHSINALLNKEGWEAEVYTDENALEEAIKNVQNPRILHVATHGFFLPDQVWIRSDVPTEQLSSHENPMLRSGLFFAGADRALLGESTPPELDDGVLTAYEATGLNLQGTELVVLSACETGLGKVKNGEGVFGLRRALQVAGAEAVLMSLWPVPDRETKELMTLFYDNWLSGKDKYKAFREAQLELRKRVKARYGYDLPFYWAAFVLVGR